MLASFNQYLTEQQDLPDQAAGIVLLCDSRILLVHPTGASWQRPVCGIPKGGMKQGEDPKEAALRELEEETGILLPAEKLSRIAYSVEMHYRAPKSANKGVRVLNYFVGQLEKLSEIGLSSYSVPKSQLQREEVDWAKFVTAEEAYPIITRAQLIILDRHLSPSLNK